MNHRHPLSIFLLTAAPLHAGVNDAAQRWSFNEAPGAISVATSANGVPGGGAAELKGWGLRGTGRGISMPGGSQSFAGYIDLPNRIVSRYDSCTIEGWVSVDGGGNLWARIFDLGDSDSGEVVGSGGAGSGMDYVTLTAPFYSDYQGQLLAWRDSSAAEDPPTMGASAYYTNFAAATTFGRFYHFAVTVESLAPGQSRMNYWRDGVRLVTNFAVPADLRKLHDVNCWLGRTQWNEEGLLNGTFDEFRIYPRALSEPEVLASRTAGPDAGLPDADGDGLPDYWEAMFTMPPSATALAAGSNTDSDGLTALQEYQNYTDPAEADTDADGMNDGAEVAAGRLPHLADLASVTYTGGAAPGDWNNAANWFPAGVPNDTATTKFHARYDKGGEVEISGAVSVTNLDFYGDSVLKPAGGGGSLTVADTLKMGGVFSNLGTVDVGSPMRGGIQIINPSGYLGGSFLQTHGTTLVNRGPDGLYTLPWNWWYNFSGGARLVNEGQLAIIGNASLHATDAHADNALINRGTLAFYAAGIHLFKLNTRTEGGVWDVRQGSISFQPQDNYAGGFYPGSVSHFHDDATFRLAADSVLELSDNTSSTIAGNSFIEGDGKVLLIGGELRQTGDNLAAKNIVMERGALTGTSNAHLRAENLELRSGIIHFPGELSASGGFQFRNKQDFFSNTGLTLRETQLDMLGTANEWAKTAGGLTFGSLARVKVWPGAKFKITGPMPTGLEPGAETTAMFINEGDIEVSSGGHLESAPYFDHRSGMVRCFSGAENVGFFRGLRMAAPIHLAGQTATISGLVEPVKPGGNFGGTGQVNFHSATLRLEPAADFALLHTEFIPVDINAPMSGRIRCGDLTLRGGGAIKGTRIEAGGSLKVLTYPPGGNYTLELREGTNLEVAGPDSLIADWGIAGQRSHLVFGEGSSIENLGSLSFGTNIMALDPVAASQDGPPFVPANTGRFNNSGTLTVPAGGLVTVHKDVGFGNSGALNVSGTIILSGRLQNGGDIIITGTGAGLSAAEIAPGAEPGSLIVDQGASLNVVGPLITAGILGKGGAGIVGTGAGGGIVAVGAGAGIISPGGGGIVTPGAGSGIIAAGAGTIISSGGGGNIVGTGAGSPVIAAGAGQIVGNNGNAIIAAGAGAGIGSTGAGSKVQTTGAPIIAAGAGALIATDAGGQIVAAGAGAGIVAAGAGAGILGKGGAGIVAPGAGAGLRSPRGNGGPGITGTVQATGDGSFISVEEGGLVEASVKIFAGTAARLAGKGTLRAPLIHDCGTLSPGSTGVLSAAEPIATLTLDGDLQLEGTSTFAADITATGHDLAPVSGDAALAGRLQVNLAAGFTPAAAQSFTILTSGSITGTFSNLAAGRVFTADNRSSFAVAINATTVTLSDFQSGAPAGSSYAAWRANAAYFTAAESANDVISGPAADPDGDGLSNQLEYALGLHPRQDSSASRPSLVRRADGALVFTWTRGKNTADSLFPETTTEVNAAWTALAASPWLVSETAAQESWSVIVPEDAARKFVRLKFTP